MNMCDQTKAYPPGTIVWVKIAYGLWWPARVVDISTVPEQIHKLANKKKKHIAIVHFETDEEYDVVVNKNNLELYSSTNKLTYLEKGFSKFIRQQNTKTKKRYDMNNFISDVLKFEHAIGGDVHIFEQFDKTNEVIRPPINELFVSSKDLKKRKISDIKRSPVKPLVSKQDTPRTTNIQSISNTQVQRDTPGTSSQSISNIQVQQVTPRPSNSRYDFNITVPGDTYDCYFDGCTFFAKNYGALKRHIAIHKNEKNNETVPSTSNTNKSLLVINTPSTKAFSPPTKKPKYNKKPTEIQKPQPDNRIIKLHHNDGDNENEIAEQDVSKSQEENAENTEKNTESTDKNSEMCTNIYSRNDYDDTSEDSVDEEDLIKHLTDRIELPNDGENSRSLLTETGNISNPICILGESLKGISIKDNPCNSLGETDSKILTSKDISTDSETQVLNLVSNTDNSHGDVNMEDTENDCDEGDMISKLPTPYWVKEESWELVAGDLVERAKRSTTLDKPKRIRTPVFKKSSQPFTPVFASASDLPPPIFVDIEPNTVNLKPGQAVFQLEVPLVEVKPDEFLTDEEFLSHPVYLAAMAAVKSGNTENVAIEIGVDKKELERYEKFKADFELSYDHTQS